MNSHIAFTRTYNGRISQPVVEVIVCCGSNCKKYNFLWDTGAQSSVISSKISNELNPSQTGFSNITGATGTKTCKKYICNIELLNKLKITDVEVVEVGSVLGDNIDGLIGMDIITLGTFSLSLHEGNTYLSFCYPQRGKVCYVEKINQKISQKSGRDIIRKKRKNKAKKK